LQIYFYSSSCHSLPLQQIVLQALSFQLLQKHIILVYDQCAAHKVTLFQRPRYHFQSKVCMTCSDLVPNLSSFPSVTTQYYFSKFLYRYHQISSQITIVVIPWSLAIHSKIYSNSFLTESHIIQILFTHIHRNTLLNIIRSYIHTKQ